VTERTAVLYDADCGVCVWTVAKILSLDRKRRIEPVALQSPEANRLLRGIDPDRRMASWHLVGPDGEIHSAGAGFAPLARQLPGGGPVAAVVSRFPRATERAYRSVAGRRVALGRLLGSGARRRSRERVERRARELAGGR
jgi:predicted DCC family thiol-disulfide oxidoreductase YuxK